MAAARHILTVYNSLIFPSSFCLEFYLSSGIHVYGILFVTVLCLFLDKSKDATPYVALPNA